MKLLKLATVSSIALGLVSTAQAVVIDNFNGPFQEVFASTGTDTSVVSPGSDNGEPEIWGSREFSITITQEAPPNESFSDNLSAGEGGVDTYQFSTDPGVVADHAIRWFGGDLGTGFDITGGGGDALNLSGVDDNLSLLYRAADSNISVGVTLTDITGNSRTLTKDLPAYTGFLEMGANEILFDLEFFISAGPDVVDLTEIQEIILSFDTTDPATDAEFGLLRTVDRVGIVVPTPGSAVLMLLGLIGALRGQRQR